MARSVQIVVVLPDGNIATHLFYAGYADLKAMSAEGEDMLMEAFRKVKRTPTENVL